MSAACSSSRHLSRSRAAQRNLVDVKSDSRQFAVVGRGILGSGFVLSAHLLAGRFGGPATPIGGAGANGRIGQAFVNVGEMLASRGWIAEKAQRNPAGHEMEFGTVVRIEGGCGLAHHAVSGRGV